MTGWFGQEDAELDEDASMWEDAVRPIHLVICGFLVLALGVVIWLTS